MDLATFGLVAAAALIHATWNMLAKQASTSALSGVRYVWAYSAAIALLYSPLAAWALTTSDRDWTIIGFALLMSTGVLHLGYSLALQIGYRRADLSVVYPIARGTGPALSTVGAIVILGEPFSWQVGAGASLVIAGVFVIGLGVSLSGRTHLWTGVVWGGATGLFIAGYTLNDGAAVRLFAISPILLDYGGNLVRLICLTPVVCRNPGALGTDLKAAWRPVFLAALLMPIPYVLVLFAMMKAPVSVIAPARELSMMVGVLFGWFFLKEGDVPRRMAGAILIGGGITLLLS